MLARPLLPFQAEPQLQGLALNCTAEREPRGVLRLRYRLSGPLQQILLPPLSPAPCRRDGLWQSTCFEAFLGRQGEANYWEINLAPSGDWNLYALSGYRNNLQPEARVNRLPFTQNRQPSDPAEPDGLQQLDLELVLDLREWMDADAPLELSATAVMEHQTFGCSYWAWQHTGADADFHRRDSFLPI